MLSRNPALLVGWIRREPGGVYIAAPFDVELASGIFDHFLVDDNIGRLRNPVLLVDGDELPTAAQLEILFEVDLNRHVYYLLPIQRGHSDA